MSQHKYGAKPTEVDGIKFHSQKEARRWQELKLLEKAGQIHRIGLQPRYPLHAHGKGKVGEYRADFTYCQCLTPNTCAYQHPVIEDVKGFKTPLYKWKKRHFEAEYGVKIIEL